MAKVCAFYDKKVLYLDCLECEEKPCKIANEKHRINKKKEPIPKKIGLRHKERVFINEHKHDCCNI